ncbi:hypothetical protein ACJ8IN_23040 [Serratia sp. CY31944]|uniref:hypothetical protein n=1 Tax=Serratia sp. CY31944 TaxID=3383598 RepID=UPI003FA04890
MAQTLTTERQQFEEWLKFHSDEEECTNLLQRNSAGTNYLHPHADLAWIAWQASRELLANREAQPVAWEMRYWNSGHNMWHDWERITAEQHAEMSAEHAADNDYEFRALYDAPPAPAVPEEMTGGIAMSKHKVKKSNYAQWVKGWNACLAAMLAAAPEGGNG